MTAIPLTLADIFQAHRLIRPYIHQTPLIRSRSLSQLTGADIWLKLENSQPTGSFKIRGALNKVATLSPEQKQRGLVTASAGNHGLGVAYAAQTWGGIKVDIFVPTTAPRAKVMKLQQFPVTLHEDGDTYKAAHQAAADFARITGGVEISAYDDLAVIAGQGTVGLEILSELPETDMILTPVGGGGLIAGIATAARPIKHSCRHIGVQPEASPAALLSLQDGFAHDPYEPEPTLADGLAGGFGALPFALAHDKIDQILLVSEAELRQAIFTLADREQLIIEASGAIAIAPLLSGALDVSGKRIVCVLSGGNLETAVLGDILVEFSSR